MADVLLDGVEGNDELPGNVLIRSARGHHLQDFGLTGRERLDQSRQRGALRRGVLAAKRALQRGQEAERDPGALAGPLGCDQPAQQRLYRADLRMRQAGPVLAKPINLTCRANPVKSSRLIVMTASMPCTSMVATTFAS
jgi:hypothetical protein